MHGKNDDGRPFLEPAHTIAIAAGGGATRPRDLAQAVGTAGRRSSDGALATMGFDAPHTGQRITPAFDLFNPPARDLVDDCVHCGFCLPSCPTYVLFGEEMDSPRGRISLMRAALDGAPLNDATVRHFDLCLGCMACVTACPSGVQYDKLIEATRGQVARRYKRPWPDSFFRRVLFSLFPYPARLRPLVAPLKLYQTLHIRGLLTRSGLLSTLPARLQALESLAPDLPRYVETVPAWTGAQGVQRARVGLLLGCVGQVFFPGVNAATRRVLAAEGCAVVAPPGQGCCGALSLHAGRAEEAKAFARATIEAFEKVGVEHVVTNAAGCGSALKEYGHLLRDDPRYAEKARVFSARVRDVSELLDDLGPLATRHPLALRVVYHDACHLAHAQNIRRQPRAVLRTIPGLEVREVPREGGLCCGSAGIYNMVEPGPAMELGERKARNVLAAGGDILAASNPGCLLQIKASLARLDADLPLAHPIELLDASIRGLAPSSLTKKKP